MGFLISRFVCIVKFDDKVNMRFPNEIPPIHGPVILSFWTAYAMINDEREPASCSILLV